MRRYHCVPPPPLLLPYSTPSHLSFQRGEPSHIALQLNSNYTPPVVTLLILHTTATLPTRVESMLPHLHIEVLSAGKLAPKGVWMTAEGTPMCLADPYVKVSFLHQKKVEISAPQHTVVLFIKYMRHHRGMCDRMNMGGLWFTMCVFQLHLTLLVPACCLGLLTANTHIHPSGPL